jgi:hypothetical protein
MLVRCRKSFEKTRLSLKRIQPLLRGFLQSRWNLLFAALDSLQPGDLEKTVFIRNEPHTVIQAIIRQIAHYTWHVGQIVLLAKHIKLSRGEVWNYMTIAPGASAAFNKAKGL